MIIRDMGNEEKYIGDSTEAVTLLRELLESEDGISQEREHFWVLGLNNKHKVQYIELAFLGTLNNCLVSARETFRLAVHRGIYAILIAHNHPSGGILPSPEDIALTDRLKEAGKILDIKILDHIILGNGKTTFCSFVSSGLL